MLGLVALALYLSIRFTKNKSNFQLPFYIVAFSFMGGELVKQVLNISNMENFSRHALPFSVCASNIIWYCFIIYGKKNSIINSIGYTLAYSTGILTTIIYLFYPTLIFNCPDNGNIFKDYGTFWSCMSHTLIVFNGIWLFLYRPYKLNKNDVYLGVLVSYIYLIFIGAMAQVIGENWNKELHNFPFPNLFQEDTWGYTIVVSTYCEITFVAFILLWYYVIQKSIPQFKFAKTAKRQLKLN